jgi:curved DNA-binding protein CbpA
MAPPNLYEILAVPKDASESAIKAAYRRLAKHLHPDHGGNPEQFRLLKLAYDVLSDPIQRRQYDLTGETPVDKAAQAAEDRRFRGLVGDVLVNIIAHAAAPQFTDIAELARVTVAQQIQQLDGQLTAMAALVARLAEVRARLRSPQRQDLLAEILAERISVLHGSIENIRQQRARWVRLQATLRDYGYEVSIESVP